MALSGIGPYHVETAKINGLIEASKRAKNRFEIQWNTAVHFIRGRHWVSYDRPTQRFLNRKPPETTQEGQRLLFTVNLQNSYVRRFAYRITSGLRWKVQPCTGDPDDINAAIQADKYIKMVHRVRGWDIIMQRIAFWWSIAQVGFVETTWDSDYGEARQNYGMSVEQPMKEGLVNLEAVSPFEMHFWPPNAPFDQAWFVARQRSMIKLAAEIKYNIEIPNRFIDQTDNRSASAKEVDFALGVSLSDTVPTDGSETVSGAYLNDFAKVTITEAYFRKKDGWYRYVLCGDQLIIKEDQPTPFGHPWTIFEEQEGGGTVWKPGRMAHVIPMQRMYNILASRISETICRMAWPTWAVPQDCDLRNNSTWRPSIPGNVLVYADKKPELIPGAAPAPQAIQLLDMLRLRIMDGHAQHEASQGGIPPGIESGVAQRSLLDSDQSADIVARTCFARGQREVNTRILQLEQKFGPARRNIPLLGDVGRAIGETTFDSANLVPGYDIVVEVDVDQPPTSEGRLAQLQMMTQAGVFMGPNGQPDFTAMRKWLRNGVDLVMDDGDIRDQALIDQENKAIKGLVVPIDAIRPKAQHNHAEHMKSHANVFTSSESMQLVRMNSQQPPEHETQMVMERMAAHMQEHQNIMQQMAQQQMKAQIEAQRDELPMQLQAQEHNDEMELQREELQSNERLAMMKIAAELEKQKQEGRKNNAARKSEPTSRR